MAVLDNVMLGATERFRRGIEVNETTLAMEAIREVGFGGDFLSHEHTLTHYRAENRYDTVWGRTIRDKWERAGRQTAEDKARQAVAGILARSREPFIEGEVQDKLKAIESKWIQLIT